MIKINLNDQVRDAMFTNYSDSIEKIEKGLESFFEEMQNIYMTHQYSPLQKTTQILADVWNNQVNDQISTTIRSWIDSESSIENILKNMGAFDDQSNESQKVAKALQDDLLEETQTLFEKEIKLSPITESVSMSKDLKAIFEDFTNTANQFKNIISTQHENLQSLISKNAEDNQLYISFGYLVKIVFSALELQIDNINNQLQEAHDMIAERGSSAQNLGRDTASTLSQESDGNAANTDFSDIKHLFEH